MNAKDVKEFLELPRRKTLELLDAVAAHPEALAILGWRPGPGRAHLAWQFMHIAATDDRHLHIRMRSGQPKEGEYVRRFAGGSVPDDDITPPSEIRRYLADRRQELLDHLLGLSEADLTTKPNPQAPWPYAEWFRVLAWHEGHHQGQAHLTFNLYRAMHDPASPKVGQ